MSVSLSARALNEHASPRRPLAYAALLAVLALVFAMAPALSASAAPTVTATPSTMSEAQLRTTGVSFAIQGFPASTDVSLSVDGTKRVTSKTGTSGGLNVTFTSATITAGTHAVSVVGGGATATTSFTVTADPVVINPVVTVTPSTVTQAQAGTTGVTIKGTGYPHNAPVSFAFDSAAPSGTATSNSAGEVTFLFKAANVPAGTHKVTLTSGATTASANFTVTSSTTTPPATPKTVASPTTLSQKAMGETGVTFTNTGFPANTLLTLAVDGVNRVSGTTNSAGAINFTFRAIGMPAGAHTATVKGGTASTSAPFTVTADPTTPPPPATPKSVISPTTLSQSAMGSTGITVTNTGFPANTVLTLAIDGVNRVTATTNSAGAVNFTFRGVGMPAGVHTAAVTGGTAKTTGSFTVTADPVVINPALTLTPSTLTQTQMSATGVTAKGTGYPRNASVTATLDGKAVGGTATSDANGNVTFTLKATGIAAGSHTFALTSGTATASRTFTVTADATTPPAATPKSTVSPATLSQKAMGETGITVSNTGFPANSVLTMQVDGVNRVTGTSNSAGAINFTFRASGIAAGTHAIKVTGGGATTTGSFTVTADPVVINPKLSATPTTLSQTQLKNSGIAFAATGYKPSTAMTLTVDGVVRASATSSTQGGVNFQFTSSALAAGTHTGTVTGGGSTASVTFTVTADPVVLNPVTTVTPGTVTQSQAGEPGFTVKGTGFPRNASVTLALDGNAAGTATSDSAGNVTFLLNTPGIPTGSHTVKLTSGTAIASTTFTVTAG